MLDLLLEADRSVNALAGHFKMSRPAVSRRSGDRSAVAAAPESINPRIEIEKIS